MVAVLGDTQLSGNVILCNGDIMNLGNGLLCGDGYWPSRTGVLFQTLPATFDFSSPHLHHAV